MKQQDLEDQDDNVAPMFPVPQARSVPPLTDEEVLALREWIEERKLVKTECPIYQRAISKR